MIDIDKYLCFLESLNFNINQKRDIIKLIYSISKDIKDNKEIRKPAILLEDKNNN